MSELDKLRAEVAAMHGLDTDAAELITGSTIEELEASAAVLAKLIAAPQSDPEPEPLAGLLTRGPAEKAARQRELVAALHGRQKQERDQQGRFASGFDGGARTPSPAPRNPEADHNALLAQLAKVSHTFRHG